MKREKIYHWHFNLFTELRKAFRCNRSESYGIYPKFHSGPGEKQCTENEIEKRIQKNRVVYILLCSDHQKKKKKSRSLKTLWLLIVSFFFSSPKPPIPILDSLTPHCSCRDPPKFDLDEDPSLSILCASSQSEDITWSTLPCELALSQPPR